MTQSVCVVIDTKGAGRLVGVLDTEAPAAEVVADSPQYYRLAQTRLNEINPETMRWVKDERGRQTLEGLSRPMSAMTDDGEQEKSGRSLIEKI